MHISSKIAFFIIIEFQNANENEIHGFGNLVVWLWKSFGSVFRGVCTNPGRTMTTMISRIG